MTETYGLTHVAVAVRNVDATAKFYCHVFDMEVMYRQEKMVQLTTAGSHDILVFEEKEDAPIGQSGGIAHFGFRLRAAADAEKVYKKILEAGGKILEKGEFVPGSPYIFFKDPDGYTLEVWYEMLPGQPENS